MPTVPTVPTSKRKKHRQSVKITPWKDVYEWQSVAHGLKAALELIQHGKIAVSSSSCPTRVQETCENLEKALETVRVWKARSPNPLPLAIEASFCLALILLQDATSNNDDDGVVLQLSYSTAIIRSVNGLADGLQQRRRLAAPVSQLCATLGLPGWIVDIRHEAAHNVLPSLSQLRLAAHTVLGFFLEKYWQSSLSTNRQELLDAGKQMLLSYFNIAPLQQELQSSKCSVMSENHKPCNPDPAQNANAIMLQDAKNSGCESDNDDDENVADENPLDDGEEDDDEDADNAWLADNYFAALARESRASKKAKYDNTQLAVAILEPRSTRVAKIPRRLESGSELETDKKTAATPKAKVSMSSVLLLLKSLPQDVAYQVIVSFFIWGDGDSIGLLLQSSDSQSSYQPLLEHLCQAWPGLLPALLTHAVEYRRLHDGRVASTNTDDCSACPLSQWLQHNSSFFQQHASAIPVHSLCARLDQGSPLRRALQDLYVGVNFVAGNSLNESPAAEAIPQNWSVAEDWEPCTIGCLAGRTV